LRGVRQRLSMELKQMKSLCGLWHQEDRRYCERSLLVVAARHRALRSRRPRMMALHALGLGGRSCARHSVLRHNVPVNRALCPVAARHGVCMPRRSPHRCPENQYGQQANRSRDPLGQRMSDMPTIVHRLTENSVPSSDWQRRLCQFLVSVMASGACGPKPQRMTPGWLGQIGISRRASG
jgi:hypothetical protein